MKIIDTRGKSCPEPLIATRRALKEAEKGEPFEVLIDNQSSLDNISRFLKDNNTGFSVKGSDGQWIIIVLKGSVVSDAKQAEDYCSKPVPHFTKGDFVIVFSSDVMGDGDRELGQLLVTNFIKAVKDLDILPDKMIFYNKGVTLGSIDSPVADHIMEIEKMGVGIFFCSTCVKFYSLEDKMKTGTLSNMFELAQIMASAGNLIKP